MAAGGHFKPGSLSARLLATIEAASAPVPRTSLRSALTGRDAGFFNRTLDRLVVQSLIRETCAGFVSASAPRPAVHEPIVEPRPLSPAQRACALAIIDRAHRYRRAGAPSLAASLLERAAERAAVPHLREDFAALASLFAAPHQTYPEVVPGPAAA